MPERFGSNESTFDALRGQTLNLPVNGSAAGAGAADSTYLRLDATNDPVTGALDVKVDSASALRVLTAGNAEVFKADTLANLIMGRLNEVWVQETKYLVVDAGGLGDYTTIQAALDYIMALAGSQTWTVLVRDGNYPEFIQLSGSPTAWRTVTIRALGKQCNLNKVCSSGDHCISAQVYTELHLVGINVVPSGSSTGAIVALGSGFSVYFWDCRIEPLGAQKLEAGGSGKAYFTRCDIGLAGRTYSDMVSSSGVFSAVYCYYCRIYGSASNGTGLVTGANLTSGTFLYHCEVFNGGGAASYDLRNAGGAVTVGRCLYNRTKTVGTITVLDGDVPALTTSDLPALTSGNIFVGNVSNVATSVTMSNDATIVASGALTLKNTGPGATGPIGSSTVVPVITIDAQGRVTALSSATISSPVLYDTEAVILATVKDAGTLAVSSDTYYLFQSLGTGTWRKSAFRFQPEGANPDMGLLPPLTDKSRIGYGETYITDKTISNSAIGSNANSTEGSIKEVAADGFYGYISGVYAKFVTGFRFREVAGTYYLEHQPISGGDWIIVESGSSERLGLNGLPSVQGYHVSMGAYPPKLVISGGTF